MVEPQGGERVRLDYQPFLTTLKAVPMEKRLETVRERKWGQAEVKKIFFLNVAVT